MPMLREMADLVARQTEDSSLAVIKVAAERTKDAAVVIRDCIENREGGWYFTVFSEDRENQMIVAEYGPYKTDTEAEGTQAKYATQTEIMAVSVERR